MERSEKRSLRQLREHLNKREQQTLSPFASFSVQAVRRTVEERIETGHRQQYAVDSDRILHSLAYTRYIDKTQVFYLVDDDHITHRVLHVQLVSKVSRTIGRFLGLNEDLLEAIALGHDIGHCPFGHDGEAHLSELCQEAVIGPYLHNLQSVRFLEKIERKGRGLNLTLQVLDGILCHDGEIHVQGLRPKTDKTFRTFDLEIAKKLEQPEWPLIPMTLEACVVRMADTIAYIGRDIEDAIRLNLISRDDLPDRSVSVLGNTNGTIMYTLVTDILENSADGAVAFSEEVSEALEGLRQFNLERVYLNPLIKPEAGKIREAFRFLFHDYMNALARGDTGSIIFSQFLDDMDERYVAHSAYGEIARDFIAGMTDEFFLKQVPDRLKPRRITGRF